ncbi:helicase C-terminal domain-containing protein [Thermopolyspora sp. NPDC052614]|uniref:helicase C-terminal domain-containing protein n=1 Tax=Thermopolyspora sp. NPDC052614 TaxID=3155682 RepID=UPI0034236B6E
MTGEFATWVRGRSDEELRALVAARPELITPVPAHIEGLVARATSPSAVGRALDRLDRFALAVVETLVVESGPVAYETLAGVVGKALSGGDGAGFGADFGAAMRATVDRLRALALVYGPDAALRTAPGVREALDAPAGLGPPAREAFRHYAPERLAEIIDDLGACVAGHGCDADAGPTGDPRERLAGLLADRKVVARLVAEVDPKARSALDELTWGPPSGRVPNARREVRVATARSPLDALLARGLLAATGEETVTLPREVALFLRGGRVHRDLRYSPAELEGTRREQTRADRTAAGQAFTFTRSVEELCEHWGVDAPGVLRTGGLAVRDLRRTASLLDLPEQAAALVVEVAHAAGLVASGGSVDGEWLPTPAYDAWRVKPAEARWAVLAAAWLTGDRAPGLVGDRDERDRLLNALHPDLRRPAAAEVRLAALAVLAAAEPGLAVDPGAVKARLEWERPRRRGPYRDRFAEFALREAEQLGVTGLGVLSAHGRALIDDGPGRAAEVLGPLLPEPVDHVLLQADLTAVAPGPLTTELGRWLALAADVESKGGATVYRFGEESIRRVLDAGHTADELLSTLERHSTTPVPQPLRYLVADVARRHGRIRVGTASAYVRCDDPAVLDEVMADRRAGPLRLRRLAPTVVVSRTARTTLVDSLRSMGYAPVAESLEGAVLVTRADTRRAEPASAQRGTPVAAGPEPHVVAAAVRAIRAGDEARRAALRRAEAPDGEVPRSPASLTMSVLQEAIRRGTRVWIGYLDSQGHATSRILEPARMEGGYLTAYDETRAAVHRFALHRITGVSEVDNA